MHLGWHWLFLLFLPVSLTAQNRLTAEEQRAGWLLLFDGKTTKGWQEVTGKPFPHDSWKVEDGCLRAIPRTGGFQDLRTETVFRSFEFHFDWRIAAAGNSGVKYLVQRVDEWASKSGGGNHARARGLEYQLADDDNEEAKDPSRTCGALYSLIAPSLRPTGWREPFHHSVLLVRGKHVEHWLDGAKLVEYETDASSVAAALEKMRKNGPAVQETPICLQNHSSAVWFKNLKIRRLD